MFGRTMGDLNENELELYHQAHDEGYLAGMEFHMGNGERADNPFDYESFLYVAWEDGFCDAGMDS
jgi:hypothetical protein